MFKEDYIAGTLDGTGKVVDTALVCSPLFTRATTDCGTFLGSAFFIHPHGLMITAKHCLFKNDKLLNDLFIIQMLPQKKHILRIISNVYYNDSDIAIIIAQSMASTETGNKLRNPCLTLTNLKAMPGDRIASFGWPNSKTSWENNKRKLTVGEKWYYGLIEEYHEEGISILKKSCYQSCMHIEGGSSGGLVANSNGHIFAINSAGSDVSVELEPYSFLSPVIQCFNIPIKADDGKHYTIAELVKLKQILFSGQLWF